METQTFSKGQTATVVAIGAMGGSIPALQPMLLGSLLAEGRISASIMGHSATAEAFGMVIGTAVAGAFLPPKRLPAITAIALLAVVAANIMTIALPAPIVPPARGLAGVGNGVLLWLFLSMLARASVPTRLYATFFLVNASMVFLLSAALGTFVIDRYGAVSGYAILTAIYIGLLLAARIVPHEYAALDSEGGTAMPPPMGWLGLLGVTLYLAGVMGFWVYSVQIGTQAGIPLKSMQMIVAAATGIQILAGLAAIALATRLTGIQVVMLTASAGLAAMLATMTSADIVIWAPAILIFAFCWMFGPPFHVAFLITADPSRRAAIFVGTAQLLGMAVGPLLSSSFVSETDFTPARTVTMASYVAVLAIAAVIYLATRTRSTAPAEEGQIQPS